MANQLSQNQNDELLQEFQKNGKLAAVKLYKEWTDCSLVDAKTYVENLPLDGPPAPNPETNATDGQQMDRILDAIQRGNKLEAVKIYKETNDASLMESKQFIENLMSQLGVEDTGGGCVKVILLAIMISAGTLIALT
ncbi:MAG: hypothetical protein P8L85_24290 [Rubripirellula sp.]|nr:hypothetical protein [Rubripirellula sp.]